MMINCTAAYLLPSATPSHNFSLNSAASLPNFRSQCFPCYESKTERGDLICSQKISQISTEPQKITRRNMAMWVFGYGSLIWKTGFHYDDRLVGFIKNYRRVFYQGSTDHRGTPERPGRTVTLEPAQGEWGIAYKINRKEDQEEALTYLEVREKQYDKKEYLDFYTDPASTVPSLSGVLVYVASADKKLNKNYLGPAPLPEIASQIVRAEGPSGPNRDYLFQLEKALNLLGCEDRHVFDLALQVRSILSEDN